MRLHAEREGDGPPVVLVHGFTQTRNCWGPLAEDLRSDHTVVRIDAPGHGRSASVAAGLRAGSKLIADQGGDATYLGYSMGGRYLVHVALAHPRRVRGLVLVGATAGIDDSAERAARAEADRANARRVREMGTTRFVEWWVDRPMFVGIPPEHRFLEERAENTVAGLEGSLLRAGTGSQEPTWRLLHRLEMPVLVVAGAYDDKYAGLGERMVGCIGDNATLALVPGAGHAAHLEQPATFVGLVRPWLRAHDL
jgi:2-succinyl-6-hydroxy-2,4-cyclohexadiene-1-carboxylate synthase